MPFLQPQDRNKAVLDQMTINTARDYLQAANDALPPMTEKFMALSQEVPLSHASFDNDEQKITAQRNIRDKLSALSDKRATLALNEVDVSINIFRTCYDRVILLLNHRHGIYADDAIQNCAKDIFVHQNQMMLHLQRANGILPTAVSHMVTDQSARIGQINIALAEAVESYKQASQKISDFIALGNMMNPSAPAIKGHLENIQSYGNNSLLLGQMNTAVIERASARISNAFDYIELINRGLIPYDMGDENDWSEQKNLLLQESLNSFNTFMEHINGAKGYLAQAQHFCTQQ